MSDFTIIQSIASKAAGAIGDELTFTYPEVLEIINLSTANMIAILGVEIFEVRSEGYHTKNLSIYDQSMRRGCNLQRDEWVDFVKENNGHAEQFVRLHPMGDGHVYILTTASWRELLQTCTVP
jgi:hypothetical protein